MAGILVIDHHLVIGRKVLVEANIAPIVADRVFAGNGHEDWHLDFVGMGTDKFAGPMDLKVEIAGGRPQGQGVAADKSLEGGQLGEFAGGQGIGQKEIPLAGARK